MEKMLIVSNDFSSKASGPNVAQISCGDSLGQENERLLNGHDPLTKMAAMPIYGKNL